MKGIITTIMSAILILVPVSGWAEGNPPPIDCEVLSTQTDTSNGNSGTPDTPCGPLESGDSSNNTLEIALVTLATSGIIYAIVRHRIPENWSYDGESFAYNGRKLNHKFTVDYGSIYQMSQNRLRDNGGVFKYTLEFK